MMKKIKYPSYKEIEENWPDGVDFSKNKVKMVSKLIKQNNPGWLYYTSRSGGLRMFIRDNFLKFKPSKEVFSCENATENQILCSVGFNRYRIPHVTTPKGVSSIRICGGGFMNIRKGNIES